MLSKLTFQLADYRLSKLIFWLAVPTTECAIHTELVVEPDIPLIGRMQSSRFQYNSAICQKDTKDRTFSLCQFKVKGRVEIEQTQSKDLYLRFP